MVFQNYALYPHMTVYRNMAFALRLRMLPNPLWRVLHREKARQIKADIDRRVRHAAAMLDIGHLLERKPKALSGGQRQRVAVGRAIVREPAAFLFDEPLSNLDAKLRVTTRAELKRLHQRLRTTSVYVTHDQEEAMTLGDRIVVMKDGRLQQADAPLRTYNHPANRFVAGFIGMPPMNFFDGLLKAGDGNLTFEEGRTGGDGLILPGKGFTLPVPREWSQRLSGHVGRHVVLGVRPEHLTFAPRPEASETSESGRLDVTVNVIEPLGSAMDLYMSTAHHGDVVARVPARQGLEVGRRTAVAVEMARAHFFEPGETGMNLSRDTTSMTDPASPTSEHAHAIA
jgi:multiple sugar transport system ATP-binding protein